MALPTEPHDESVRSGDVSPGKGGRCSCRREAAAPDVAQAPPPQQDPATAVGPPSAPAARSPARPSLANAVLLPRRDDLHRRRSARRKVDVTDPDPVLEAEIFDPATGTFAVTPAMQYPRQSTQLRYCCAMVECCAPAASTPPTRSSATCGRWRCSAPVISTPDRGRRSPPHPRPPLRRHRCRGHAGAGAIASAVLIRPNLVTHHSDASNRLIKVPITAKAAASIDIQMPATAEIAPPGYYLLLLLDASKVPSQAEFIRIG